MNSKSRVYIAGHKGLVGSAIVHRLQSEGFENLLLKTRLELDLCSQAAVEDFFRQSKPEYVILAAAKVGGILANNCYPADFIRDNLQIQLNVIDAAWRHGAKKLMFLGSSCIYPREANQPIREEALLSGALEPTNQWYAVAKIAGIKMCQAYRRQYGLDAICLMPTNLYGPGDNFDLQGSHVLPALIRKFHEARVAGAGQVTVWGTGRPRREFLHVDDLADAVLFLARHYSGDEIINVGTGKDLTITELARKVAGVVGYEGKIVFDTLKPDGTLRKQLDVSRLDSMGWRARVTLDEGIRQTYGWYREQVGKPVSVVRGGAGQI